MSLTTYLWYRISAAANWLQSKSLFRVWLTQSGARVANVVSRVYYDTCASFSLFLLLSELRLTIGRKCDWWIDFTSVLFLPLFSRFSSQSVTQTLQSFIPENQRDLGVNQVTVSQDPISCILRDFLNKRALTSCAPSTQQSYKIAALPSPRQDFWYPLKASSLLIISPASKP